MTLPCVTLSTKFEPPSPFTGVIAKEREEKEEGEEEEEAEEKEEGEEDEEEEPERETTTGRLF